MAKSIQNNAETVQLAKEQLLRGPNQRDGRRVRGINIERDRGRYGGTPGFLQVIGQLYSSWKDKWA